MGWFKRKMGEDNGASLDMVSERIAGSILHWQVRFSAKLNALAKKINKRLLMALMVIAGLLFGGYCLWLVCSLFR
ncbi:hypothetical protein GM921_15050 [Pedobacter sp. LMG 31464]|uniref:Uncharacterized protein n=1 Tax=Pedobacter planticolens TaxID=2679964 RepID=A0A923IX56_9SPHI|nr:hypothetical protein [Pedobacter planticolens]MBB2146819.1 hypothetical protein [Pedobacter planticolens]